MSLKSVWGFDLEESIHAQRLFRANVTQESAFHSLEERDIQIPPDIHSQI
jgi:hypothetical protein